MLIRLERWNDLPGYEGRYLISNTGLVKSLPNKVRRSEIIMKQGVNKSGYKTVGLHDTGPRFVHNLVLQAFVGPRPGEWPLWQGCHGDGDKNNNYLSNLRWDTCGENSKDRVRHGNSQRGSTNFKAKIGESEVREIRRLIGLRIKYDDIADMFSITKGQVGHIKAGRSWGWLENSAAI